MQLPSKRLRQARISAGFSTVAEAAEALKLNQNTWTSNENGNRPISRQMAPLYAAKLGIDAGWLLYGEHDDNSVPSQVPLVSWVSAGTIRREDGVEPTQIERHLSVAGLGRGDWIALQVTGDSMDRIAPDGATIIVDRSDSTLINDRFYVFALDDGSTTFKQWRREPRPTMRPYSTNLDHLAIPADIENVYVVGRVRKIINDV